MADRQLVLSEALCFIVNKFGKTGRNELNTLRSMIVDFYTEDIISAAKCRLLDDISAMTLLTEKPPRVPRRREGCDPKARTQVEVDDIFKQLIYLDERKLLHLLPIYVSAKPDTNPTTKLCEGDLKFLFMYMDRMEARLQGHGAQLAAITRDVRSLMRTETRPVHLPDTNNPVLPPPAGSIGPVGPVVGSVVSAYERPNNKPSGVQMHADRRPPPATGTTRGAGPIGGKNRHWAANSETTNSGNPRMTQSSVLNWGDIDSQLESADERSFVPAESRRARAKRRKILRSQEQEAGAGETTDASADERGFHSNRPSRHRRRVKRAPLMVGKATTNSNNDAPTAARPLVKKAVFCIDNVKASFDEEKIQKFIEDLDVTVLSCLAVNPRRRRNETIEDAAGRIAFRVCIKAEDVEKLMDAERWPEHVGIYEWYHIPPDSDKGVARARRGVDRRGGSSGDNRHDGSDHGRRNSSDGGSHQQGDNVRETTAERRVEDMDETILVQATEGGQN